MANEETRNQVQHGPSLSPFPFTEMVPTPREMEIVLAIVNRARLESWDSTARKLNISRRTLFEHRQNPRIQRAVQMIVINHLRIDSADVLTEVVRKARKGNLVAAKLFLDQTNVIEDFEREREQERSNGLWAFVGAFREVFTTFPPAQRLQFIEAMQKREINIPNELYDSISNAGEQGNSEKSNDPSADQKQENKGQRP
jgi:hypothetical protein